MHTTKLHQHTIMTQTYTEEPELSLPPPPQKKVHDAH